MYFSGKSTKGSGLVVAQTFNPNCLEAGAGKSLKLAWSTGQVPGQAGLHRVTVLKNTKEAQRAWIQSPALSSIYPPPPKNRKVVATSVIFYQSLVN